MMLEPITTHPSQYNIASYAPASNILHQGSKFTLYIAIYKAKVHRYTHPAYYGNVVTICRLLCCVQLQTGSSRRACVQ